LHTLSEHKSSDPQRGMCFLPRRALNVSECEIARAYKVSGNFIEPIGFVVPRRVCYNQLSINLSHTDYPYPFRPIRSNRISSLQLLPPNRHSQRRSSSKAKPPRQNISRSRTERLPPYQLGIQRRSLRVWKPLHLLEQPPMLPNLALWRRRILFLFLLRRLSARACRFHQVPHPALLDSTRLCNLLLEVGTLRCKRRMYVLFQILFETNLFAETFRILETPQGGSQEAGIGAA
jgi:hypothetical protein